jgi:hypothetical protein
MLVLLRPQREFARPLPPFWQSQTFVLPTWAAD